MSKLVLLVADGTTLDVPLKRERITIGRRPNNDVCLPNLAVSGEHAAVVTILADSFLEDLGSTNGTLVNGKAVAKHFLRDGDEIDIGRHVLVYCAKDDAVLAPDRVRAAVRAAGDPDTQRDGAKPVVRTAREPDGALMRREREAANVAAGRVAPKERATQRRWDTVSPDSTARMARLEPAIASVKLLSGPAAGRVIPITKPEVTIGRAGVQVATIRFSGDSFALKPVEGEQPPILNSMAVAAEGMSLTVGDVIEIVGIKVEFGGVPQTGAAP